MKEFSSADIENDPLVQEFFDSRPITAGTKKNYLNRFRQYSNLIRMLPKDLIYEAEHEEDAKIRSRHRKIKKHLNDYVRHLETTEYAPGKKYSEITIGRSITDIKTFYHYYDIVTPKIILKPENPPRRDDLPTLNEIEKALRNVNTRDKALILIHLSSGMAGNEVRELKTKDFIKGLDIAENTPLEDLRSKIPKNPICTFWIIRIKENIEYVTFCSPQCVYAIVDYLEEKGSYSEYLFPSTNDGQMSQASHVGIFTRINDKLGFGRTANGKQRRFTSHKLRAVFSTNMYASGVDWTKIDQMLGHTPNKITRAYRRPSTEVYKLAYIEGLDSVTTDKINVIDFRSPEVQELKNENVELKEQLNQQDAKMSHAMMELNQAMRSIEEMDKKNLVRNEMNIIILKAINGNGISEEDKKRLKYLKNKSNEEMIKLKQQRDDYKKSKNLLRFE
jgi:integrase